MNPNFLEEKNKVRVVDQLTRVNQVVNSLKRLGIEQRFLESDSNVPPDIFFYCVDPGIALFVSLFIHT